MRNYVIYNLTTGEIKSTLTTSGLIPRDVPEGYGYIQTNEVTKGKAVNTSNHKLVDADTQLPYVLTLIGLLKRKRNHLLAVSDWTQFPDSPLSDTQKSAWATYRQTLRDIPADNADVTSIDDVTWPTPP